MRYGLVLLIALPAACTDESNGADAGRVQALEAELAAALDRIEALETRTAALQTADTIFRGDIEDHEEAIGSLELAAVDNATDINALGTVTDAQTATLGAHATRLTSLESASPSGHDSRISALESSSLQLEASVGALEAQLGLAEVVRYGDFYIDNDAELVELEGATRIDGSVFVSATGTVSAISLPSLRSLSGRLEVRNSSTVAAVHLPALEHALGVTLETNAALISVDLSSLMTVDELSIYDNDALQDETLDLGALRVVRQHLYIARSPLVETIDLSSLESARYVAFLSFGVPMANLTTLDLTALRAVSNDLDVSGLAGLSSLTLPNLRSVGGTFQVRQMEGMLSMSVPRVEQIMSLRVTDNPALTAIRSSFPALLAVNDLTITNNTALPTCDALALFDAIQAGMVTIGDNGNGTCD
jgi:hypothetical protein